MESEHNLNVGALSRVISRMSYFENYFENYLLDTTPAPSAPPCRENPCDRACRPSRGDMLLCRADFPGKSIARKPSPDTDPNKRKSSADSHRDNGLHLSGTPCSGYVRSA